MAMVPPLTVQRWACLLVRSVSPHEVLINLMIHFINLHHYYKNLFKLLFLLVLINYLYESVLQRFTVCLYDNIKNNSYSVEKNPF